ncbi:methyltransferase type 11 [Luminiphilus syltensis NOR5-1B]|uniref:Methyltransferase type 11 n=1 Tax=Luminiphilus syltensis NOR5-1B TaxID=565045 RepID=B8KVL4_9GAMM|nr:class I SAM-dependent methyltransferase [Luminiphilus syltensis]EED35095.1 methyltransferase type 11 [Luminiphilus syltensis NOR5-1B]
MPRFLLTVLLLLPLLTRADDSHYGYQPPSRDGIGKTYMTREISHVMGHRGAAWLERPSREREERTDLLLDALPIRDGDVVADLGAGSGYFSLPIAKRVGSGRVLAIDIQPEMLDLIRQRSSADNIQNIDTVLATVSDPKIPSSSVDLLLLVDAYHEFSHPREVMQGVMEGLVPGGKVILVEYRAEDPRVPIKPLHKMTEQQAKRELEAVGFNFVENLRSLPQQHILVFRKPLT